MNKKNKRSLFLSTTYYNSIGNQKKYIVNHLFAISSPGHVDDTIEDIGTYINLEKQYLWNGKVGLMKLTDYMQSTTSINCKSLNSGYQNAENCGSNNWLNFGENTWTISPYVTRIDNWFIYENGRFNYLSSDGLVSFQRAIHPVVYLSSLVELEGTGTQSNPYRIKE